MLLSSLVLVCFRDGVQVRDVFMVVTYVADFDAQVLSGAEDYPTIDYRL